MATLDATLVHRPTDDSHSLRRFKFQSSSSSLQLHRITLPTCHILFLNTLMLTIERALRGGKRRWLARASVCTDDREAAAHAQARRVEPEGAGVHALPGTDRSKDSTLLSFMFSLSTPPMAKSLFPSMASST